MNPNRGGSHDGEPSGNAGAIPGATLKQLSASASQACGLNALPKGSFVMVTGRWCVATVIIILGPSGAHCERCGLAALACQSVTAGLGSRLVSSLAAPTTDKCLAE
jgi:hypothetical protein